MFKQFRNIEAGELLVAGYDMATGVKDFCAVQFISKQKADVPIVVHSDRTASEITNFVVYVLEKIYDKTGVRPVIAPETNSGGVYEIDRMLAMNRYNKFQLWEQPAGVGEIRDVRPKKYGWTTTPSSRPRMLADLKYAIDNRVLRIYDETTIKELYSFIVVKSGNIWKAQAETKANDDLVMALAIAYQLFLTVPQLQPQSQKIKTYYTPQDFGGYDILDIEV